MSLLHDIQAAILDDGVSLGSILLKLRFLADRLGSDVLEEWVRQETEGYGKDGKVPAYRKASVSYTGTFTNGVQILNNVSIAPYLIKKHGGDGWVDFSITDPVSVIETMLARTGEKSSFTIDTGNLKLLIEGKIYKLPTTCVDLHANIDPSAFVEVVHAVRAKLLDLTFALEKKVPVAALIEVGKKPDTIGTAEKQQVAQLTQNIFYGPVHQIANSGTGATLSISVTAGHRDELVSGLIEAGVPKSEATELAEIVEAETPDGASKGLGAKTASWLATKAGEGAGLIFKGSVEVGKNVVTELIMQYYGLK